MTFRKFAFNNVIRNKRTYAAYFLSSMFSVLVFFVYAIFAFHPALNQINGNVAMGLHFAEGIIYVFSFLFVLVSMSAFLKSRKKEFGLMVMLGMTNNQLRKMVFLENVFIGFFATICGMLIGLVFAKVMLLAAENILDLAETLPFYWPIKALLLTFVAFLLLFIIISFSTVSILKGNKLIDLIKGSAAPKKEPKASVLLSILAVALLVVGYGVALIVKEMQVVMAMIPVTIIVIIGTYFLFTQLSVYTINKLKKKKRFFWKNTNLVLMSDLAYRMKDNARTFFFVAIVSTVAFSAIGSLVGFRTIITSAIVGNSQFAFEYRSYSGNELEADHLMHIRNELNDQGIKFTEEDVKVLKVPVEKAEHPAFIVNESKYNHLAELSGEKTIELKDDEAILMYYQSTIGGIDSSNERVVQTQQQKIMLQDSKIILDQKEALPTSITPTHGDYLIIDDVLFDELEKTSETEQIYYAFSVKDWKDTIEAGKNIANHVGSYGDNFQYNALGFDWYVVNQSYGAILFVGLFIGAVFFVAAGSFLYFRLYADLDDEKRKFSMIGKMGLTDKELSKIITIQLGLLFFVPILVAIIHGAVALTALQNMFDYNLFKETALVLGSFSVIQIIYFLFIRANYIKKIRHSI